MEFYNIKNKQRYTRKLLISRRSHEFTYSDNVKIKKQSVV